jgi:hypothetical protein
MIRTSYWRNVSPKGAIGDLVHEWRRPNPYRWRILAVSVLATLTLGAILMPPSVRAPPPKPEITYISTLAPNRSDAQIVAENRENQKVQDAVRALDAERAARRKEFFRTLGRASGFDVDKLEKQYSDTPKAPARATGGR